MTLSTVYDCVLRKCLVWWRISKGILHKSDLSPIEHVWDEMKRRLSHLQNQSVEEMGPALIRIWNNIPQAFLTRLDQCVAIAKPASMQMVDTQATDFDIVQ